MSTDDKKEGQLTLNQMLKALDKDVATGLEKKIKKLSKKAQIKPPLDDNKAKALERKTAYAQVSKELKEWDSIVEKRKHAKHLKFPLEQERDQLPSNSESLSDLKPRNDFESRIMQTIDSSESVLPDKKEFSKAEEKYLKAISEEEAKQRHQELQRMRVLLSSYAAKMRRQKAIKSKSYRRLLKQDRIKKHLKKVESDKDQLKDELEFLQKLRAKERATLKHKNTGKWAKHAKFRAKYDDEARQAMYEQIGLSEKLRQRPANIDSESSETGSDDDDDDDDQIDVSDDDAEGNLNKDDDASSVDDAEIERRLKAIREEDANAAKDIDKDEEQHKLMAEAFADDDVVAEFRKAKEDIANEEQPKDKDLFLPGWDTWTGPGTKVNKKKKKRYQVKAKRRPRMDDKLGNVIISEDADAKISSMQLAKLPHNIRNEKKFSKLMEQPITATFVPQQVHREAIKPAVVTKMGTRIEPMKKKRVKVEFA